MSKSIISVQMTEFSNLIRTAWSIVRKAGQLIDVEPKPHDVRRHAATYVSRSGKPLEIVSTGILRHADLSTTQRYLGKVNNTEVIRRIEKL